MQIAYVRAPATGFSILEAWHVSDRQAVKVDAPLCILAGYPDRFTDVTIVAPVSGYFYLFKPVQSILAAGDALGIIADVPDWSESYLNPIDYKQ